MDVGSSPVHEIGHRLRRAAPPLLLGALAALAATGCGSSGNASSTAASTTPVTTSAQGQGARLASILMKETNDAITSSKGSDLIVSLRCAVVKKHLAWRCKGTSTKHEAFLWSKVSFDARTGRLSTPPPTLVK